MNPPDKKPFIPKEGRGRLFINRRKETKDHPDFKGDAMFNGVHIEISGWNQEDGSISVAIQRKGERRQQQPNAPRTAPAPKPAPQQEQDDIPF
jgi:hypothetical protein